MIDIIKSFYEQYPFPPPAKAIEDAFFNGTRAAEGSPAWLYHLYWPTKTRNLDLDILIAGCGTSAACTQAASLPQARITAIDVSAVSLEHSKRLADKYNLKNIDHRQCAIEDIASLKKSFDLIICIGVLHHTEDPIKSLKALKGVLKPDGSIYLMLYGQYGRTGLYMLQEMFRRIGVDPATLIDQDVRDVARTVKQLPKTHPFLSEAASSFSEECLPDVVDLFLNPRDEAYTVPKIYALLDAAGMEMQHWIYRTFYSPYCVPLKDTPFVEKIKKLSVSEQYAIGELHRGSISKHHFICCAKERTKASYVTDLSAPDWKNLIPMQNLAVSIEEKAVPDNRSQWLLLEHYNSCGIKIDFNDFEAALFNHIDGQRTIQALQSHVAFGKAAADLDRILKDFFKSLYEHDLVWFRKAV